MATTDDARHQSESARQRLNELAQELARRTTPEELKALAREKGDELKDLARHKADEVVADAKQSAKEKVADLKESAVHQGERMKERAERNPAVLGGLVGGALGIGAGLLAKKFADRRSEEFRAPRVYTPEYGYQPAVLPEPGANYQDPTFLDVEREASTGEKIKENVTEKIESAKEKVGHAREDIRQRIPSAGELKARSRHYVETSGEHPFVLAALGVGLGVLASRLIPESDLERQKLGEVKERAAERFSEFGKELEHRVSGDRFDDSADTSEALTTSAMNEPVDTWSESGPSLH